VENQIDGWDAGVFVDPRLNVLVVNRVLDHQLGQATDR
jgi:hypothetical protein